MCNVQYKQATFQCMNANLSALCVYTKLCKWRQRGVKRQLGAWSFSSWSAHHQCPPHTSSKWTNLWPSHWLFVMKKTSSSRSCGCCPVGVQHSWVSANTALFLLIVRIRSPSYWGLVSWSTSHWGIQAKRNQDDINFYWISFRNSLLIYSKS